MPVVLPLVYFPLKNTLSGATWNDVEPFYDRPDPIRKIERASIRAYMEFARPILLGKTLDFGCGTRPYKDCVEGEYVGVDQGDIIPPGPYDTIICNQVLQYIADIPEMFALFRQLLRPGGNLVLTFPTNWDEVEPTDLHRFTLAGVWKHLVAAEFSIVNYQLRATVCIQDFSFPLGYGIIARKN